MFSSLSSFIFGTSTPATANSETNQNPPSQEQKEHQQQLEAAAATADDKQQPLQRGNQPPGEGRRRVRIDAADTISITQLTPSVTGDDSGAKREKPQLKYKKPLKTANRPPASTQSGAKLLTPREAATVDENDFEEDWLIAEKQTEEDLFSDCEDQPVHEPKVDNSQYSCVGKDAKLAPQPTLQSPTPSKRQLRKQSQRQQQPHINAHSTDVGARPETSRNQHQRASNRPCRNLGRLELHEAEKDAPIQVDITGWPPADEMSYGFVLPIGVDEALRSNQNIEESWFITPPPCFTVGPMVIETSPFENLLIEHPSMSVYHSITQLEANAAVTVSMDGLKLQPKMTRSQPVTRPRRQARTLLPQSSQSQLRLTQPRPPQPPPQRRGQQQQQLVVAPALQTDNGRSAQAVGERAEGARVRCHSATLLKQELLARGAQKMHDKKERQSLCRGALKRANKARDVQSKANRQRRADRQHCRVVSGANNNRKCCY